MHQSPVARALERAVKIILWGVLVLPLYVSSSFLFPFITGKNFAFRIFIELAAILWIGLMLAWPEYRPRLTLLVKISTIFIFIVFLADLLGPNPYRSFFSNYERMEGFMMIGHLWLYFLMLVSMMRTKKNWSVFFHTTLSVSMLVACIALLQKFGLQVSQQGGFRVDATIGNPAYLAAYLLFHIWIAAIMLERRWKIFWARIAYATVGIFEIIIVYFTATRGAVLALLFGVVLVLAVAVLDWRRVFPEAKKYPRLAAILLGVIIVIPVLFWQLRHTSIIKLSPVLPRFASMSLSDGTTRARFSIWGMSFRGAMERPILGWGQENYYLVFQKYYNPKLYAQEPWFDRSHNIILDWLVHTGFAGLIAYFSLLVAAGWSACAAIKKKAISRFEGLILIAALAAYVIQDLFVFDNLNTYLLLFGFLAYVNFNGAGGSEKKYAGHGRALSEKTSYAIAGVVLAAWIPSAYVLHVKPMQEATALIHALTVQQAHAPLGVVRGAFQEALAHRTFGDTEVREQVANVARGAPGDSRSSREEQKQFVDFALEEMKKQISGQAPDVKHMIFLSSILDRSASLDPAYAPEAQQIIERALTLAPSKQILYFEAAQVYLVENKPDAAIAALRAAIALEPSFQQASVDLMIVGGLVKRPAVVSEGGTRVPIDSLDEETLQRVANAYQQVQDFPHAQTAFERLVELNPSHVPYHATLAALYAANGKIDRARAEAAEAARRDPNFAKEAADFLKTLR